MSSEPSASKPSPAPSDITTRRDWQRLLSLDRKLLDDRQVLASSLGRWCAKHGVAEAALYSGDDGPFSLRASLGGRFAPQLCSSDELAEGWRRFDLPGVRLLYRPGAGDEPDTDDGDLLLLASGARISALKEQIQEQRFQAKFRGVELEALYDVGLAIASTLDLEKLCDEALLRAVSLLDARRGALYLLDGDAYCLTSSLGGAAVTRVERRDIDVAELATGELRQPQSWLPGATHLLSVPVEIEHDPRGLLVVADKESRHGVGPFPSTDRRTLSLFANQAAIALENAKLHKLALEKERLEREMELAAEIQTQLLPKTMPEIPGFEVLGWNRPARQVGGDYFDVFRLEDQRFGLVVGDVTGKGLPAALLVSTLHSALRVLLDQMPVGPPLVERLSRYIYEASSANKFITLLLAVVDQEGHLAYLNAGHNPGLVIRRDGSSEQLPSGGLPLGLLPGGQFEASSLELGPEDLLCIYSDGITECEAPDEEELGLERLIDLLSEHRRQPLQDIIATIDDAVTRFAQGQPQGDDQTVVLLRRAG